VSRYALVWAMLSLPAWSGEWTGTLKGSLAGFPEEPLGRQQHSLYPSLSLEASYSHTWPESDTGMSFKPFLQLDPVDHQRSHVDFRELYWFKRNAKWDLRLGICQEHWGNLYGKSDVDFLNQADRLAGFSGGAHLGQPMLHFSWYEDWGTLNLYALPGFRAQQFPGKRSRPFLPIEIDDDPLYGGPLGPWNPDVALRFERHKGAWDIGLSQFYGTLRDPSFIPYWHEIALRGLISSRELARERLVEFVDHLAVRIVPRYDLGSISAVDLQYIRGATKYKLESMVQFGEREDRITLSAGLEHTFSKFVQPAWSFSALAEYHHEHRTSNDRFGFFDNNVVFAGRLALNDRHASALQGGGLVNLTSGSAVMMLGYSRQLGPDWQLNVAATIPAVTPKGDPLWYLRHDGLVRVQLAWFF